MGCGIIEIGKLKGKQVITTDAFLVGEISEANMDEDWRITHIKVKLSKEATTRIGFKKPLLGHVTICLPVNYVKGVGDVITLTLSRVELEKIPECKGE